MTDIILSEEKYAAMNKVAGRVPHQGGSPRGRIQRTARLQDEALTEAGYKQEEIDSWRGRMLREKTERIRQELPTN